MVTLNLIYQLKEGFDPPDNYVDINAEKIKLQDGIFIWFYNCIDYLKGEIIMLIIHLNWINPHSIIMETGIELNNKVIGLKRTLLSNWVKN